jgi:hypothetical protein
MGIRSPIVVKQTSTASKAARQKWVFLCLWAGQWLVVPCIFPLATTSCLQFARPTQLFHQHAISHFCRVSTFALFCRVQASSLAFHNQLPQNVHQTAQEVPQWASHPNHGRGSAVCEQPPNRNSFSSRGCDELQLVSPSLHHRFSVCQRRTQRCRAA